MLLIKNNGKFGGRSDESNSLPYAVLYWNMSKYKSVMTNGDVGVVPIIKMASHSPNTPVGCFTVTQDLSTEDIGNLSKAKKHTPKFFQQNLSIDLGQDLARANFKKSTYST